MYVCMYVMYVMYVQNIMPYAHVTPAGFPSVTSLAQLTGPLSRFVHRKGAIRCPLHSGSGALVTTKVSDRGQLDLGDAPAQGDLGGLLRQVPAGAGR